MPIASFEVPAFLIHNNIPIYQMYKDDWYESGPYTYFYSIVPYPDKEEKSFDIRDLSSFDANLSIKDNLKKAIDEKSLPLFHLPVEEQKEYFYDQAFENISTTPEQDACYLFIDELYTRMANGSSTDAFHSYLLDDFTNRELTFFIIPERNENNSDGYHLYIYDFKAAWNDFYNKPATKELFVSPSELTQALFIAMEVPYPLESKSNPEIDMEKLQAYLEQDMILEFDSIEECLHYFNTYDYQKLKTVEELKAYQQEYGFGVGEKWYHVNFSEALDVYKTDKNASLKTMIKGASKKMNENNVATKHITEPER